jgi:hypothetical protein
LRHERGNLLLSFGQASHGFAAWCLTPCSTTEAPLSQIPARLAVQHSLQKILGD